MKNNSCPKYAIKHVLQKISEEQNNLTTNGTDNSNNIDDDNIYSKNKELATLEKHPLLVIPYEEKKETIFCSRLRKKWEECYPIM